MGENRLYHLLHKQFDGTLTEAERLEISLLTAEMQDHELEAVLQMVWDKGRITTQMRENRSQAIWSQITDATVSRVSAVPHRKGRIRPLLTALAAAVLAGVIITAGVLLLHKKNTTDSPQQVLASSPVAYTRYLKLPDSTTVVLHAGSKIEYDHTSFNKTTREVLLSGEAYFIVAPAASKPFTIHAGGVSTLVLGTAFNVKAYPGQQQVVVSVTDGKVAVQKKDSVLALLAANQQLVYTAGGAAVKKETVNATAIVHDWTMKDMVFDGEPLSAIMGTLAKRYNVSFRFGNPALSNCRVKISFAGTETLENVLSALSVIQNITYVMKGSELVINGDGCE